VTALLIELCKLGFLPIEKRQCLWWCPGWWCQVRQGGGTLFLVAQMSQNVVDNVLVLDAGDDSGRTTAAATDLDVDAEHTFQGY
jgi:hypothetical protein